jgi:hypothetical protein
MDSVITLPFPDLEAGLIPVINYGHTQLLQDIIERALRALMSEPLTSIKRPGNFAELPPLFIQG